jgi:hypothetical protein
MATKQLYLFPDDDRPGFKKIFRPWRKNPKTGRVEYPRNGRVFVMWVPIGEEPSQ